MVAPRWLVVASISARPLSEEVLAGTVLGIASAMWRANRSSVLIRACCLTGESGREQLRPVPGHSAPNRGRRPGIVSDLDYFVGRSRYTRYYAVRP
jgi:hypothetical protein